MSQSDHWQFKEIVAQNGTSERGQQIPGPLLKEVGSIASHTKELLPQV
jgi:hypothetical protein